MAELNFYRGLKSKYSEEEHRDGIYFATDSEEIILNGTVYRGIVDNELTEFGENPVTSSATYSSIQRIIKSKFDDTKIGSKILADRSGDFLLLSLVDENKGEISSATVSIASSATAGIAITYYQKNTIYARKSENPDNGLCNISFKTDYLNPSGSSIPKNFNYLISVVNQNLLPEVILGSSINQQVVVENIYNYLAAGKTATVSSIVSTKTIIPGAFSTKSNTFVTLESYGASNELEVPEKNEFYLYRDIYSNKNYEYSSSTDSFSEIPLNSDDMSEISENFVKVIFIDLILKSDYNVSTVTTRGNNLSIGFTIEGSSANNCTVSCWVDDINSTPYTISGRSSDQFIINTTNLSHGSHVIQMRAQIVAEDLTEISSNLLYYRIIIIEPNNTTPVIGCRLNFSDGELILGIPELSIEQFNSYTIDYSVNTPGKPSSTVEFFSDGSSVGVSSQDNNVQGSFSYRYLEAGSKKCFIKSGQTSLEYNVNVKKSDLNIDIPNYSGLYLNAYGKSNQSSDRNTWTYGEVTSSFTNVSFGGDGWIKDEETGESMLRLINGGRVEINYKPFDPETNINDAISLFIRFKVTNVSNESEEIIRCMDEKGIGLLITTQEARFVTKNGKSLSTKFAAGIDYNIGIVSYPFATGNSQVDTEDIKNNSGMIYLYLNGIMSGGLVRETLDSICQNTPQNITISADTCNLDIYSIRSYKSQINDRQALSSFMVDSGTSETLESLYGKNDLLDSYNNIDIEKIHTQGIPYFIISGKEGDVPMWIHAQNKNNKDDKYPVDRILYVDPLHPEFNFRAERTSEKSEDGPHIRLQGTSSLQYPIKNYRIYTKNCDVYQGCSESGVGGTLLSKGKYSFSTNAVPVNCWCLKADFMESSSSHNTGMANLVHEVLGRVNEGKGHLTPPQRTVKEDTSDKKYKYDVRTTVDGHPCIVFYNSTVIDKTVTFAGKFNFNNDKSTESVFGFLGVNGYHDNDSYKDKLAELARESLIFPEGFTSVTTEKGDVYDKEGIINLLENNPTECWEFTTNDTRMGEFLDADFSLEKTTISSTGEVVPNSDIWTNAWEARFPDEDGLNAAFNAGVQPRFLKRLVEWINSTDTTSATNNPLKSPITYEGKTYNSDSVEYRQAKFHSELKYYFDVNFLCDYYTLNDIVAGVDQRVKNMMFAFWYDPGYITPEDNNVGNDGMLCYPIYYDNDTIFGLDNGGELAYNWDIDENSTDKTGGAFAFAGHNSVLWKNLRETCQEELKISYTLIRSVLNTNENLLEFFDKDQCEFFPEILYNKDALLKYVNPTLTGATTTNVLKAMQGTRAAHRRWFVENRLGLFDSKYNTGLYASNNAAVGFKAVSSEKDTIAVDPNTKEEFIVPGTGSQIIRACAYRDWYFGMYYDKAFIEESHKRALASEQDIDDINTWWSYTRTGGTAIGSITYLRGVTWMKGLDMSGWNGILFLEIPDMPVLERFYIGNNTFSNSRLTEISLEKCPLLKEAKIINCTALHTLKIGTCRYLETLDIRRCSNLQSVSFPEAGNLRKLYLPYDFQTLSLKSLPKLSTEDIIFDTHSGVNGIDTLQGLIVDNCKLIDGYSYLMSIVNRPNNSLKNVRITNIKIDGNGDDLIKIMSKGIGGFNSSGRPLSGVCSLVGTYRLTTLLENDLFDQLCAYFPELILEQPKYTTFVFTNSEITPKKISNYDNQTGYEFGNDYKPSGYIAKILEQRHSYMVKRVPEFNSNYAGPGTFAACQLDPKNSYLYLDGETQARLDGSDGDFCMYEPHYWYKGVNDFLHGKIYVYYSTLPETPTTAKGTKYSFTDLIERKKCAVNATDTDIYNTIDSAIITENDFITYKYIFPKGHSFVRARVMGVASNRYGCVVCDEKGNIIRRYLGGASTSNGMFNGSYLWFDIPQGADSIYFTVSADTTYNNCGDKNTAGNIYNYALYLTPSWDIEDLEPDWVEHKAAFIGKILSSPGDSGDSVSGFMTNDFYPTYGNKLSIPELYSTIQRGSGFEAFDYDAYREILLLGYLKYGTTYLQNEVGQGRQPDGTYGWNKVGRYFPANQPAVNYAKYGEQDTTVTLITNIDSSSGVTKEYPYVSVYSSEGSSSVFPAVSTLMGYHQMISNGGTISSKDYVDKTDRILTTRTGRTIKVFSIMGGASTTSSYKFARYIQGGRYIDILGIGENDTTYNNERSGYCLTEMMESATGSTAGYLVCGYQGNQAYTPDVAACLRITSGTSVNSVIDTNNLDRVLRVMIIPNHLVMCSDYTNYKNSTSQN